MVQQTDLAFEISLQQKRNDYLMNHQRNHLSKVAISIKGQLDILALEKSIQQLLERHEILRTAYSKIAGLKFPRQVIFPSHPIKLVHETIENPSENKEWIWDLTQLVSEKENEDVNFICKLFTFSEKEHILILALSPISIDCRSFYNIVNELHHIYKSITKNQELNLEEPLQYVDFSGWQEEMLLEDMEEEGKKYWKSQIEEFAPVIRLPLEKESTNSSYSIKTITFCWNKDQSVRLDQFAKQLNVTNESVLFAAWMAYLYRLSGENKIKVNYWNDGRNFEDLQDAIGLYEIMQPVVSSIDNQMLFSSLVLRSYELIQNNHVWLDDWLKYVNKHLADYDHLGKDIIGFQYYAVEDATVGDEISFTVNTVRHVLPGKLLLRVTQNSDEFEFQINYDESTFSAQTIQRMARQFETLLDCVMQNPEVPIIDINILPEEEAKLLLEKYSSYRKKKDITDVTLPQLFEEQVAKSPDQIAVIYENDAYTFSQLNERANRLAHYLRKRNIKPDDIVAIYMDRSIYWFTSIFGILKAGGAYLPLNLDYPKGRTLSILKDASVSVVITTSDLADQLTELSVELICLDTDWTDIEKESTENPTPLVKPENLAYVIYTSGTTGKPKGVQIQHRSVVNLLEGLRETIYCNSSKTLHVALNGPFVFDTSVKQIIQILDGHTLHLLSTEVRFEPEKLFQYFKKHKVNVIDCTPSQLAMWIQNGFLELQERPRYVLVGGEAIGPEMWQKLHNDKKTTFYNLYGPTECTVDATICCIQKTSSPTIGHPILNTQVFVLDEQMRMVPLGATGELYIGGAGLARGFLNDPQLTSERFVPHPYSNNPGDRLYKTGDLVKFREDGALEFVGRNDHQVKVRGHRIELGEIEFALCQHPSILEAIVIGVDDGKDGKRLAAYMVPKARHHLELQELRDFLKQLLPEYMIPATFTILEKIPLTTNGKIDYQALPSPEEGKLGVNAKFVPPRTPEEKILCEIWQKVIGVEQVGIHDNFFALGGDSIMIIQAVSLAKRSNLHLTPGLFFQYQTVAELAQAIDSTSYVKAQQDAVIGEVMLTPIQHRFFERAIPEPHHWNQSVLLKVLKPFSFNVLTEAFNKLLEHHDALRLRFHKEGEGWKQFNAPKEEHQIVEYVDVSHLSEEKRLNKVEEVGEKLQKSLNLSEGPIVKAVYFDHGNGGSSRLLIVVHHLAMDGVSWRILLEDLEMLIRSLEDGQAPTLPKKTTSYQEWSQALYKYAQKESLSKEMNYWIKQLDSEVLPLPVDWNNQENLVQSVQHLDIELDQNETSQLIQTIQSSRVQMNELLLAALFLTISKWTGQSKVLIDLEGHGREEELVGNVDLSRTVGWFTTVYPLLLECDSSNPLLVLRTIREQLRSIPNKGFGFGVLKYLTSYGEELKQKHHAEISFNYLGHYEQTNSEESIFESTLEPHGNVHAASSPRLYLLDINAMVVQGRLHVVWSYNQNIHRQDRIQELAEQLFVQLKDICSNLKENQLMTVSDFPLATLTEKRLKRLVETYGTFEHVYDLSPLQEHMVNEIKHHPRSGQYLYQLTFTIEMPLHVTMFKNAWEQVMLRHHALRCSLWIDDEAKPMQIIHKKAEVPIQLMDWSGLSQDEQKEQLHDYLLGVKRKGLDLTKPPAFELALITLGENRYQFAATFHLLFLDVPSFVHIVLAEVFEVYEQLITNQAIDQSEKLGYDAYVGWVMNQDTKASEEFWKGYLEGVRDEVSLPFMKNISPETEVAYVDLEISLSEESTEALQKLAKDKQITLNMLFQGIWAYLLSKYTDSEDVLFGMIYSGRPASLEQAEQIVGRFVNMLPFRMNVTRQGDFFYWIKEQYKKHYEIIQNQHISLEQIMDWNQLGHKEKLFNTCLVFENVQQNELLLEGFSSGKLNHPIFVPDTDIPFKAVVIPDQPLKLMVSYLDQYFDKNKMMQILEDFKDLTEYIAHAKDLDIAKFPIPKA